MQIFSVQVIYGFICCIRQPSVGKVRIVELCVESTRGLVVDCARSFLRTIFSAMPHIILFFQFKSVLD
jgi:hypothetical protein